MLQATSWVWFHENHPAGSSLVSSHSTNTGTTPGCVLSPFLSSLYTNNCTSNTPTIKLIKFPGNKTLERLLKTKMNMPTDEMSNLAAQSTTDSWLSLATANLLLYKLLLINTTVKWHFSTTVLALLSLALPCFAFFAFSIRDLVPVPSTCSREVSSRLSQYWMWCHQTAGLIGQSVITEESRVQSRTQESNLLFLNTATCRLGNIV